MITFALVSLDLSSKSLALGAFTLRMGTINVGNFTLGLFSVLGNALPGDPVLKLGNPIKHASALCSFFLKALPRHSKVQKLSCFAFSCEHVKGWYGLVMVPPVRLSECAHFGRG